MNILFCKLYKEYWTGFEWICLQEHRYFNHYKFFCDQCDHRAPSQKVLDFHKIKRHRQAAPDDAENPVDKVSVKIDEESEEVNNAEENLGLSDFLQVLLIHFNFVFEKDRNTHLNLDI